MLGSYGGNGGAGGAGVVGSNLNIVNTGAIVGGAGGAKGAGTPGTAGAAADAIDFTGGANQLTPGTGTLTGALAVTGSLTVHTAAAGVTLGNVIKDYTAGAGSLSVDGAGTLTLSGVNIYTGGPSVTGGSTVAVAADAGLGAATGGLLLDGGTLEATRSFTSARGVTLGAGGGVLQSPNGAPLTLSGVIADAAGAAGALTLSTPAGANNDTKVTLTGADTYTGATTLTSNTELNLAGGGSISASSGVVFNVAAGQFGADLDISGVSAGATSIESLSSAGAGAGAGVDLGGKQLTITAANGAFGGSISDFVVGGAHGGGSLAITAGVQTLTGASTYTGAALVNGGVLAVDGSLTSAVTVAGGATLRGTGTDSAGVTVQGGGTFTPGETAGASTTGTFTAAALTLNAGSTFAESVAGAGALGVAQVGGAATLGGVLTLNYTGGAEAPGTVYTIVQAGSVTGTFTDATVTSGGHTFAVDYTGTAVTLTDVTPVATVTSDTASPATGDLGAGRTVTFTLAVNAPVTVTGAPVLTLNDGGMAAYEAAQSTGTSLVFSTTVATGQNAATLAVTGVTLPAGASIKDAAGNNANLAGAAATFTGLQVDTTAPAAPSTPADAAVANGYVNAAHDTAGQAVTVTAEAGSTVEIFNNGQALGAAAATGSGTYSLTLGQLADGAYSLTAQATDGAGNVGAMGGALAFTVDATPPTTTAVSDTFAQNAAAAPIHIPAPSDNLTAAGALAVTVTGLPTDGTVTLADGVTPVTAGESLTPAQLTGLEFTPAAGAAGVSSTFTYTVADGAGNATAGTATLAVGAAGAPAITGAHDIADRAEAPTAPFATVSVSDPSSGAGATETLTITQTGAGGTLSGAGLAAGAAAGTYTLSGAAATVTSELQGLSFTPAPAGPNGSATTSFSLSDRSSTGAASAAATVSVTDTDPAAAPAVTGGTANQATADAAAVPHVFAGVVVSDPNAGAPTETVTIALGGAGGTLTGAGAAAGGVYTLTGSAAQVNAQLGAIGFTPTPGAPASSATTTFSLTDASSAFAGASAPDTTPSVTDTRAATAPVIGGVPATAADPANGTVVLAPGLTVSDANAGANIASAQVTVGGFVAGDQLSATAAPGSPSATTPPRAC